mgnify:FL=1
MAEITERTKNLISKYALWKKSGAVKEGVPTIHVDEVASKVATFYEQIRTIIDWKEEHLMRRAAIIRKLKRRFIDLELRDFEVSNVSEPLIMELIRGGYFQNDRIGESKIKNVENIISKYVFILKNNPEYKNGKMGLVFYNSLLEIASCEIEETLSPSIKEMALIDYMFETMLERIKVNDAIYERNLLGKEDKDIQIYIAVQQALFKFDNPIISYNLLKYKYPYWNNPNEEEILKISQNIHKIIGGVAKDIVNPMGQKFYAVCEKYDTPYLLLGDVLLKEDLEKIS